MLNQLLPKVDKAHSKAKGVLTLVPLPKIDEIYAKLEGSTIYSTFDMRSRYYHHFQMLVNKDLEGLDFTFGYLDDILIFSKNMEEHLQHV